jgi:outer membrane protein W
MNKVFVCVLLFITAGYSQYNNKLFSIGVNGIYTTTAKIYLSPNSSDPFLRNNFFPLESIFNGGVDFRYQFTEKIILSLSTEYMKAAEPGYNLTAFSDNSTVTVYVQDGFIMIPLELSAFYLLPFSTENFKFLMGAGGGFYFGEHVREFGDAEIKNENRRLAYGIHVAITVDYLVSSSFSFRTEMKFRDPQFIVTSRYVNRQVNYMGKEIELAQESFESKINIDGVTFMFGIAFHF